LLNDDGKNCRKGEISKYRSHTKTIHCASIPTADSGIPDMSNRSSEKVSDDHHTSTLLIYPCSMQDFTLVPTRTCP